MGEYQPGKGRKLGVIINYFCVFLIILLFYTGLLFEYYSWIIITQVVAVIVGVLSFLLVYIKTGIWKLVHTKTLDLDERELQLVDRAVRYSYAIMSVTLLIIIYVISLVERSVGMVPAICLVYLAHILPASVIAWLEPQTVEA